MLGLLPLLTGDWRGGDRFLRGDGWPSDRLLPRWGVGDRFLRLWGEGDLLLGLEEFLFLGGLGEGRLRWELGESLLLRGGLGVPRLLRGLGDFLLVGEPGEILLL